MINDVLDLAKVESGKLKLEKTLFNATTVLHNLRTLISTMAKSKNISVILTIDTALPLVLGDEQKFKQIMFNLLSNAIKFTGEGGFITVVATILESGGDTEDCRTLEFSVEDNGIGILPENHERIFNEFEQVDSSYSRSHEGAGLGLALARKFVELQGGRIRVHSEGIPGRGSVFKFTIPVNRSDSYSVQ